MSIIRISDLSGSDLNILGNNMRERRASRRSNRQRNEVSAVNRSLARTGERISRLHRPLLSAPR